MPLANRQIYAHVSTCSFASTNIPGVQSIEMSEAVDVVKVKAQNSTRPDETIVVNADVEVRIECQDVQLWSTFTTGTTGSLVFTIEAHSSAASDLTVTVSNCTLGPRSIPVATGKEGTFSITLYTHSSDGSSTPVAIA